jgi:Dyp-type peroxidase family
VTAAPLVLDDIQGIVAAGYGHLPAACFVLLGIRPGEDGRAPAANAWLARLAADVTAACQRQDDRGVQVAFTHHGVTALGLSPAAAGAFATEFVAGMAEPNRSRALGDVGDSAPARWAWGGPQTPAVDILLMLYAKDGAALDRLYRTYTGALAGSELVEVSRLGTIDLGTAEAFGFADGISQPSIDGLGAAARAADTIKAGEFLLGYANEYGQYPPSPMLGGGDDPAGVLAAGRSPSERDFGRNGTYLVFRELRQDVDGFLAFLDAATRRPDGTSDQAAALHLAAKMVGRWPSGAPLVLAPDHDDTSLATANDFGYFHEDRDGLRCPIGAHIRRANPRDSLPPKPGSEESIAVGKRHRLIRRGRQRGPAAGDGSPPPRSDRGIHFICLNASIARQFEFIQGTWCDNPKFGGLYDDRDPLVSTVPGQTFRVPGTPVRARYTDLPSFITVVGGAYFFLPGVRAVRYLGGLVR